MPVCSWEIGVGDGLNGDAEPVALLPSVYTCSRVSIKSSAGAGHLSFSVYRLPNVC